MNSINTNLIILLPLVLSSVLVSGSESVIFPTETKISVGRQVKVEMFNSLPNGESLTIHCKSKDDDLGVHVITPVETYDFSFKVNAFGTTLFFCGVSWKGGSAVFDIYNARLDRCRHYCKWVAKGDFIFGYPEHGTNADIVIPWK